MMKVFIFEFFTQATMKLQMVIVLGLMSSLKGAVITVLFRPPTEFPLIHFSLPSIFGSCFYYGNAPNNLNQKAIGSKQMTPGIFSGVAHSFTQTLTIAGFNNVFKASLDVEVGDTYYYSFYQDDQEPEFFTVATDYVTLLLKYKSEYSERCSLFNVDSAGDVGDISSDIVADESKQKGKEIKSTVLHVISKQLPKEEHFAHSNEEAEIVPKTSSDIGVAKLIDVELNPVASRTEIQSDDEEADGFLVIDSKANLRQHNTDSEDLPSDWINVHNDYHS